jgi:hypothetical protein
MTGAADSIVKKVCLATGPAGSSGLTAKTTNSSLPAPSTEHKCQGRPPARNLEFEMWVATTPGTDATRTEVDEWLWQAFRPYCVDPLSFKRYQYNGEELHALSWFNIWAMVDSWPVRLSDPLVLKDKIVNALEAKKAAGAASEIVGP